VKLRFLYLLFSQLLTGCYLYPISAKSIACEIELGVQHVG